LINGSPRFTVAHNRNSGVSVVGDVRFSQAQARELLRLEPETIRHWRKCLAPLGAKPRRASYGRADLLALAVVREFVHGLGIPASSLTPLAVELFQLCGSRPWPYLSRCQIRFEDSHLALEHTDTGTSLARGAAVLIPLAPLIAHLGQALLGDDGEAQRELRFPLTAQPGGRP
jgi:hypothetical protein